MDIYSELVVLGLNNLDRDSGSGIFDLFQDDDFGNTEESHAGLDLDGLAELQVSLAAHISNQHRLYI